MARRQAAASASVTGHIISPAEYQLVYDYVGKGRYLQVAVSKSVAQLYAAKFGTITSRKLSIIAAQNGWPELLVWARSIGCIWNSDVFLTACENNRINILEELVGDRSVHPWNTGACFATARKGHVPVLKWLHERNAPWDENVCSAAAEYGQLEALQFLFANGCPCCRVQICADACRGNHLNVLQWLHAEGCPVTLEASGYAAVHGDIEMLRWIHANNCPWDSWTCSCAARSGSLEKLQFLRAHGCPWDCGTIGWSDEGGHHDVLQWARENGCPEPPLYPDSSDGEEED